MKKKILHKPNLIILPQLYQVEVLFRSHEQIGHQGIDKVQQRILHRFVWPGVRKACKIWVNACLSCLQVKDSRKMKLPLKSLESAELNEVVQINHRKKCLTERGYNQIPVLIDHFTKLAKRPHAKRPLRNGLCRRNLRSLNHTLDLKIRMSHDLSIRKRKWLRWVSDEKVDEKISYCPSTFNDLPPTDE